ncbi:MAG: ATP-binding protein [Planctomycetaceae bacterium]|nr:ATP-binding protein [Planctomycetaceae bacterium]
MFGQKKQTAWFFDSSVHLEAISRLLYLIEAGESFGVICGPDGCGRTRVLTRLREEAERTGKFVVSLNVAGMDSATALTELVTSISSAARRSMAFHELIPLLRDELAGRAHCGMHSVILIDDLHRAQTDMESLVRVLTAVNSGTSSTGGRGKLTVIAASDRPLKNGLSAESLLQISLSPLDSGESFEFVRSLARRHGIPDHTLHDNAIRAIFDLSRGNAARMSRVCELLAVLHETTPNTQFNTETVSAVISELAPRAVA